MAITKEEYFKEYKEEKVETAKDQMVPTGFPEALKRYRLLFQSPNLSVEEAYYWIADYMREGLSFGELEKITDIFAASEHSAFFGVAQQRIGLQQDKISQFLATIGKMIKEVFQLVREIRILDERLDYYKDSYTYSQSSESAEITLKGIYIDQVEGGAKNPASIYGMSRELQFTTLPDLFFATHPQTSEDVDKTVNKLDFNNKVKEVLKRKLRSFLQWKEYTFKEMKNRRSFTVKYLRQHYTIIRMYMNWVKPYLKNVKRLRQNEKAIDTPDIVGAFEGSMMEIELLGKSKPEGNKDYYAVSIVHMDYRTKPSMNYQQEGYQRGPIHVGKIYIVWRAYSWTQEEIDKYKAMRQQEEIELWGEIDNSFKDAIEGLGDDFVRYLKEAGEKDIYGEKKEEKKEDIPKQSGPFVSVFKGFGEIFGSLVPAKEVKEENKKITSKDRFRLGNEEKAAKGSAVGQTWTCYKNYKKAHKIVAW